MFDGWIGGPGSDDEGAWHNDDGTYESPRQWIAMGVIVPLALLAIALCIVIVGGVWLPGGRGTDGRWFRGGWVVATAVTTLIGVAAIFVARFFLPNVFRKSYGYQYVAAAGIALCFVGMIGFIIAAVLA